MSSVQVQALVGIGEILKGCRQANRMKPGRIDAAVNLQKGTTEKIERGQFPSKEHIEAVISYYNLRDSLRLKALKERLAQAFPPKSMN